MNIMNQKEVIKETNCPPPKYNYTVYNAGIHQVVIYVINLQVMRKNLTKRQEQELEVF